MCTGPPTWEPGPQTGYPATLFTNKRALLQTELCSAPLTPTPHLDDPVGEAARCGVPGLTWLHVVCGCEASFMY
jgi:hypothetical protein